jgi:hypothetical protein
MSKDLHNFENEPDLPLNNGEHLFGLPSNYFDSFENKLRQKMELENELKDFPLLTSIQKNISFTVPISYFHKSRNAMEIKAELLAYSTLQNVKPLVFNELEADYIKQLYSSINYKIELVEELKPYQTLYNVNKANLFIVPDTYFESVGERVKSKIYSEKENRVSVLESVLDFIFGRKIAFTFGLITIVSLSVYFHQSTESAVESGDCKTLACLERQEILNNTKAISNFDEDQLMDLVDVNSLNNQLNSEKEKPNTLTDKKLNLDSVSEEDLLDEL